MNWFRSAALGATLVVCPAIVHAQAHTLWQEFSAGQPGFSLKWSDMVGSTDGTVYACGTEEASGSTVALVRCWNPNGTVKWTYRYTGSATRPYTRADKIVVLPGKVVCVGAGRPTSTFETDLFFLELFSETGEYQQESWVDPGGWHASQLISGMATDGSSIAVTGESDTNWFFVTTLDGNVNVDWDEERFAAGGAFAKKPIFRPNGNVLVAYDESLGGTRLYDLDRTSGNVLATEWILDVSNSSFTAALSGQSFVSYRAKTGYASSVQGLSPTLGPEWLASDPAPTLQTEVHYSEGAQALYQLLYGYDYATFRIRKYAPDHSIEWEDTVTNDVGSAQKYLLTADRFGNPLVVGNSIGVNDTNVRAWCWDQNGRRQWSNQLGNTGSTSESASAVHIDEDLRVFIAGASSPFFGSGSEGLVWRTSQRFDAVPTGLTINSGQSLGGGVSSVQAPDDSTLIVGGRPTGTILDRFVNVSFTSTLPVGPVRPTEAQFGIKIRQRSSQVGITQLVQLWEWSTNTWVSVNVRSLPTTMDTLVVDNLNVAQFVDPVTRQVQARIVAGRNRAPARSSFKVIVDYVEWFVNL